MTLPGVNLQELIAECKGDRSYADLERDGGGAPSSKRWWQIATKADPNFPDPATIRAIARALSVTETTVVLAAARSAGLTIPLADASRLAELLPPAASRLSRMQVAAVRQVVKAMVEPTDIAAADADADAALDNEQKGTAAPVTPIRPVPQEP